MKPVDQTLFAPSPNANCMQAAMASLLEMDLNDVPNFIESRNWFGSICEFLAKYNLQVMRVPAEECYGTFHIAIGLSPRNVYHMVIYQGNKLAHDPHPSRAGIVVSEKWLLIPKSLTRQEKFQWLISSNVRQ